MLNWSLRVFIQNSKLITDINRTKDFNIFIAMVSILVNDNKTDNLELI